MKYQLWIGILLFAGHTAVGQNVQPENSVKRDSTGNKAAGLARELKGLGFLVRAEGKSVVVGVLKNGEGPVVTYCADMECNVASVKHACGYAAHVARLIGVAKAMAGLKNKWQGTLLIVGQPLERSIPVIEASATDLNYYRHSVPQPHYIATENQAAMNRWRERLVSEECSDLEIHNARNDNCYIIFGTGGGSNLDFMAIPLGVKSGVDSLMEIFKWATAAQ